MNLTSCFVVVAKRVLNNIYSDLLWDVYVYRPSTVLICSNFSPEKTCCFEILLELLFSIAA